MGITLNQLSNTVNKVMSKVKDKYVLKEDGKSLSSNDYTTADKTLVSKISSKVDKVEGKGLSANDYSTEDKNKVAKINIIESNINNLNSQIVEKVNLKNVKIYPIIVEEISSIEVTAIDINDIDLRYEYGHVNRYGAKELG